MAMDYLGIMPSIFPSERCFSIANLTIDKNRSNLAPDTVQELLCLKLKLKNKSLDSFLVFRTSGHLTGQLLAAKLGVKKNRNWLFVVSYLFSPVGSCWILIVDRIIYTVYFGVFKVHCEVPLLKKRSKITNVFMSLSMFSVLLDLLTMRSCRSLVPLFKLLTSSSSSSELESSCSYNSESVPIKQFAQSLSSVSLNNSLSSCQTTKIKIKRSNDKIEKIILFTKQLIDMLCLVYFHTKLKSALSFSNIKILIKIQYLLKMNIKVLDLNF
ncbi:hypothetical protein BpHYR1_002662 [Brachionus plicatilis]|uniref:HAT C-terminal dimerisation domain-containing protein n=1 Tax=Brachionus plicatilis TaxID=10195 RepID=A0A3M7RM84_BRAPC|nr:hypothetical protein BpHYR1_002662 [Brachionus plicatilis]